MSSGKNTRRPLTPTRRRKVIQFLQANQEMLDNMNDQDLVTALSDHIQKSDHWIQHSDVEHWWNQHGEARRSPSPKQQANQQAIVQQSSSEAMSLSSGLSEVTVVPTLEVNTILINSGGTIFRIPIHSNTHLVLDTNDNGEAFAEITSRDSKAIPGKNKAAIKKSSKLNQLVPFNKG
ncbi:hypothetical protein Fcan01_01704 [Folsomia candida]|uniref:Uncharacterized protein n=1 Tax=Folsomia candida TaxID=158441 RepID=A0A226EZK8_FOLCA|nr:hypothetical protein Fcan01_01704 [Folsomia candida]